MLTIDNISCERGGKTLFKNLGFTLGDCCILAVRGPNGSGKTSLLNIISCLLTPNSGTILYANEDVKGEHWPEYCEIIQYIGHKNAIKPQLTVTENLLFWAKIRGSKELVPAALAYFDLGQVANVPCAKLSAGWQRRVGLARLIACKSEIWLLDEPFTNLDDDIKNKLVGLISARAEQGGAVIIATHDDIPIENIAELDLRDFA